MMKQMSTHIPVVFRVCHELYSLFVPPSHFIDMSNTVTGPGITSIHIQCLHVQYNHNRTQLFLEFMDEVNHKYMYICLFRHCLTREVIWHKSIFHKALEDGIIAIFIHFLRKSQRLPFNIEC